MPEGNMVMLQFVANGLGPLKDDVVFVGGCVAELYAVEPELSDIRPTQDVDCIIEISSYMKLENMENELRKLKFSHDTSEGAPVCRWIYGGIKVDIMPTNADIIGFSNCWYPDGMKNKTETELLDGTKIFILPPEYYLATKFEAHKDRGGNDLRTSHDFEDIIYVLDNNDSITDIIKACSNIKLKQYLVDQCLLLINNDNIMESIECMLPVDSQEKRTQYLHGIIKNIASIDIKTI